MFLIIIFCMIIIFLNIEILFFNEELIICLTLILFFYLFFYNFKLIIKKYFFYKIDYIFFVYNYLINLNIKLIEIILKNLKIYNEMYNYLSITQLFLLISKNITLEIFNLKKRQSYILNFFYKNLFKNVLNILSIKYLKKNININIEIKYLILYK